jgi:hypothetical protein
MTHVSDEQIRPRHKARTTIAVSATVTAAVLAATTLGPVSASAHQRRPTVVMSTVNDDGSDYRESSPGSASTTTSTTVAATRDTATSMSRSPTSTSMPSPGAGTRYRVRTIDDAKDPTFNQLLGINDRGRIVGYFGSGADAAHPNKGFRVLPPYRQRDFLDKNAPGSAQTQVVGVNNAGVAVGFFVDANGANIGFVAHGQHYTPVANPATSPTAPFNQLLGINNHGIAVGFYNDANGAAHGYTYNTTSAVFTPVDLPDNAKAENVTATGIADDGDISGFYTVGKTTIGFVIIHGELYKLSFGANSNTQALGINNSDRAVGSYLDTAGVTHGFVWSPGSLVTVDNPDAANATVVNGLNNRGQLVGFYTDHAGNTHGFLATRRTNHHDDT